MRFGQEPAEQGESVKSSTPTEMLGWGPRPGRKPRVRREEILSSRSERQIWCSFTTLSPASRARVHLLDGYLGLAPQALC